jgi:hypothetical protein
VKGIGSIASSMKKLGRSLLYVMRHLRIESNCWKSKECRWRAARKRFIYGTNSWLHGHRLSVARDEAIEIELAMESPQAAGWYSIVTALHPGRDSSQFCYQWLEEGLRFYVVAKQKPDFIGVANLRAKFTVAQSHKA